MNGAARPVTNESSLPKEMEDEKEERANKGKIRASRLSVSYLYGCVQPKAAAALSIPLKSAMCSELAKGSSACEERKHSSYFWTQHHRSQSRSELCFLIIRDQKWERRKKTSLAPPKAYPRGRIGTEALALFIPSLWVEEVLWRQNSLKQRKMQWLEMSLSLKYPTGFQKGRGLRGCQPKDPTWLPGEMWCPAASALAGILP